MLQRLRRLIPLLPFSPLREMRGTRLCQSEYNHLTGEYKPACCVESSSIHVFLFPTLSFVLSPPSQLILRSLVRFKDLMRLGKRSHIKRCRQSAVLYPLSVFLLRQFYTIFYTLVLTIDPYVYSQVNRNNF